MSDLPTGRELDAAIAEACGWTHEVSPGIDRWTDGQGLGRDYPPFFSADLNAAFTLGAEAERLGFAYEFYWKLVAVFPDNLSEWEWDLAMIHATAEQRATAFLAAWREKNNADTNR